MKIYTKTGDKGITSLYDSTRHGKDQKIFSVLGDMDELTSHIGMLKVYIEEASNGVRYLKMMENAFSILEYYLSKIQSELLDIGSNLATVKQNKRGRLVKTTMEDVEKIEIYIDKMEESIPKLTKFIIPGVTKSEAQSHICRSISRRFERGLWSLKNGEWEEMKEIVSDEILCYVNRLSDFFFTLARFLCVVVSRNDCFKSSLLSKIDLKALLDE
jgi:cob(I)alamin adenosyltransferase